ncbi:hypothetical protein EC991_003542 [Linnemannia zychae]|nr:hypothetical protein EC991_003542 [Linnemannia zychae]
MVDALPIPTDNPDYSGSDSSSDAIQQPDTSTEVRPDPSTEVQPGPSTADALPSETTDDLDEETADEVLGVLLCYYNTVTSYNTPVGDSFTSCLKQAMATQGEMTSDQAFMTQDGCLNEALDNWATGLSIDEAQQQEDKKKANQELGGMLVKCYSP